MSFANEAKQGVKDAFSVRGAVNNGIGYTIGALVHGGGKKAYKGVKKWWKNRDDKKSKDEKSEAKSEKGSEEKKDGTNG